MKKTVVALMLFAALGFSLPSFAAEPSLHEVYQAASSGKLDAAQHMMQEVLQAHPNSGKAHYVEAELLAKQGQLKQAANELALAEKFAPGLPFATPQAVSGLRASIERHGAGATSPVAVQQAPFAVAPGNSAAGFPWGMLLLGLGLIAFIVWASKLMARRNPVDAVAPAAPGLGGYRPAYPVAPYDGGGAGYGAPGVASAAAPGLGSRMLGGLATGAAVGAGVVAGEALLHRFMDGPKAESGTDRAFSSFDSIPDLPPTPVNDMGGADFGIADTSWDDAGAAGDNDWT